MSTKIWVITISTAVIAVAASATIAMALKQSHDHQVAALAAKNFAAKKMYIAKLQKVVDDSTTLDSLLYDSADRYLSDEIAEQQAQQDMAEVIGEVSGSPDSSLLGDMLSRSQVMTKAVCQCSEAITTNQEMLAAYDADKLLQTDMDQLKGRIVTLTAEAK